MKKQERTVNLFTVTTEKRICMSYSSGYSTVRDGPAFLPDFSQNAFFDNLVYYRKASCMPVVYRLSTSIRVAPVAPEGAFILKYFESVNATSTVSTSLKTVFASRPLPAKMMGT
jgi:hypothetical protein